MKRRAGGWFVFLGCTLALLLTGCESEQTVEEVVELKERIAVPEKYRSLKNVVAYDSLVFPTHKISLIKEAEYGDSEGFLMGYVGQFTVDKIGRVYIVSGRKIEVFDESGKHLSTLGRSGRGPGEFNNMTFLKPKVTGRFLFAYDDILSRVSAFT